MAIRPRSRTPDATLTPEDTALLVYGPWHPAAAVPTDRPLHHPRCATARLQGLLEQHGAAIDATAAAAGIPLAWARERVDFVSQIGRGWTNDADEAEG